MGVYSLDELVRRWQISDLTTEQAIGQMLLVLQELDARVQELERAQPKRQAASPLRKSASKPS